jgi:hypothetical protein
VKFIHGNCKMIRSTLADDRTWIFYCTDTLTFAISVLLWKNLLRRFLKCVLRDPNCVSQESHLHNYQCLKSGSNKWLPEVLKQILPAWQSLPASLILKVNVFAVLVDRHKKVFIFWNSRVFGVLSRPKWSQQKTQHVEYWDARLLLDKE